MSQYTTEQIEDLAQERRKQITTALKNAGLIPGLDADIEGQTDAEFEKTLDDTVITAGTLASYAGWLIGVVNATRGNTLSHTGRALGTASGAVIANGVEAHETVTRDNALHKLMADVLSEKQAKDLPTPEGTA